MAIEVKQVTKRQNGTYIVTVQDTGDQTGLDEKGNPIYRTYSVVHNPKNDLSVLKQHLADKIKAHKAEQNECDTLKTDL